MSVEMFNNLKEIVIESPADRIVDQLNELISSGQLKPGDKMPSERFLSEKFNVGRMFVRDALTNLEFYGILKKNENGGRIVTGNRDSALMTLANKTLNLVKPDYTSLMEVRFVLEIQSVGLAAERADQKDIIALTKAVESLGQKVALGEAGLEEDFMFHSALAEASKNEVIRYLVSYLVSHMMNFSKKYDICRDTRNLKAYNDHVIILEHVKNKDIEKAKNAMREHLTDLFGFISETSN